jgi:hypothetical protein
MTTTLIRSAAVSAAVVSVEVVNAANLYVGFPIVVSGLGEPLDGPHTISAIDGLTISWAQTTGDIALFACLAQLEVPIAWITQTDVEDFLGVAPASEADDAFLARCVESAQRWAYRRRIEAGYVDHPSIVPGPDAFDGTVLKAAMSYRERGSIDSFSGFDTGGSITPVGSIGQVKSLLGLDRAAIA